MSNLLILLIKRSFACSENSEEESAEEGEESRANEVEAQGGTRETARKTEEAQARSV